MAQRFGGKFSPDQDPEAPALPGSAPAARGSYLGARRTRAGGRVNLLFLAPMPLIWQAFSGGSAALAMNLAALGLLLLAAWLTREGILAQEAFETRKVARKPAFPRKIAGSLLTGLGLGVAGAAATGEVAAPLLYAVLGAGLHGFAFGIDPLRDKGIEGVDAFQTDRVARAVGQAETLLTQMRDAVRRAGDRQAEARVEQFQVSVRDMLRTVEDDPRDLTAARRYLSVYLMGARDATVKFANINARSRDAAARTAYIDLLADLEQNFTAKTRTLLRDDQTDLEIEIDVLRDRLKREGIRPDTNGTT